MALDVTAWAPKPNARPPTPPTVSSGWMLTPTTCITISAPTATRPQPERLLSGSSTRPRLASGLPLSCRSCLGSQRFACLVQVPQHPAGSLLCQSGLLKVEASGEATLNEDDQ